MARTYSQMTALGTPAPDFELPAANPAVEPKLGAARSLAEYADAELLVIVFTCNHCPYALHVEDAFIDLARMYRTRGVAFVAICANDAERYPEDAPAAMAARAKNRDYPFAYLHDATQETARAYGAVCTPDFFVYDRDRQLAYRGRFDATRPGGAPATGDELRRALDDLLADGRVSFEQQPAMGCNIKWRTEAA